MTDAGEQMSEQINEGFEEEFREHARCLCARFSVDDYADDALQEMYVRVLERLEHGSMHVRAYSMRVLQHLVIDEHRRRSSSTEDVPVQPWLIDEGLGEVREDLDIEACLDARREVRVLHELLDRGVSRVVRKPRTREAVRVAMNEALGSGRSRRSPCPHSQSKTRGRAWLRGWVDGAIELSRACSVGSSVEDYWESGRECRLLRDHNRARRRSGRARRAARVHAL